MTMVAIRLTSFEDVRMARECVVDLAQAAGIQDLGAAVLATGELGNNCVEHGDPAPGLLWISCRPGRLRLQFENRCEQQPNWRTQKPMAVAAMRTGGYGLVLARALADRLSCHWAQGRVVVRAEFLRARGLHAPGKQSG
jgi:anti-sigma regulatory factor (Ser/Thr protein kinase)